MKIVMKFEKLITRKTHLYPGDKTIQVRAVFSNGSTMGIMNLTPRYFNGKKQYENDRNGFIFSTIAQAKMYCINHYVE